MAAWQLALLAMEGLKLLFALGGAASTAIPAESVRTCYTETASQGGGFTELVVSRCPSDFTTFTLPAEHWSVKP